jgi:hyperosmotically inducible periplasmic protein
MSQEKNTLGESIDDAAITALVETTLRKHRSTAAFIIAVETKNGVVKIDGKAGNWDEKNLVTKLLNNINCLKMVFNNMTIDRNMSKMN